MPEGTDLIYIAVPPRKRTDGAPPLLILLHGVGSNEEDLIALAPALDPRFQIVSLRAPYTLAQGAYAWFHVDLMAARPTYNGAEATASRDLLAAVIPAIAKATGADPQRVYLLGFSQGAIMDLYLALTRPELVAGVVAMSGRLLSEAREQHAQPEALAGLPVLEVHGTGDATLPVHHGRAARDFLTTLPLAYTYREYPMGHTVGPESLADVAAWLTARLDAPPR